MLHYLIRHAKDGRNVEHRNYWKLQVFDDWESKASDDELNLELRRQRGLLDYNKCTLEEVQTFVKERRLDQRYNMSLNDKKQLIACLEFADDYGESIFEKFKELPAELRVLVYEHYFDWLPTRDRMCAEPPITKVSRLVRKEALPLWYLSGKHGIYLSVCSLRAWYSRSWHTEHLFLKRAPQEVIRQVSKLRLRVRLWLQSPPSTEWVLEFSNGSGKAELVSYHDKAEDREVELARKYVEDKVTRFQEILTKRGQRLQLERGDADLLLTLFEPK